MQLVMLKSKIHRAIVTATNIDYEGSISLSKELMVKAQILLNEQVHIYDINNGTRFITYIMEEIEEPGVVCVNGAAARLVEMGDLLIIASYELMDEKQACQWKPIIVKVDFNNRIA